MNELATVMNLRVNFQNEYRLHKDASNQTRNDIVTKYHDHMKPLLKDRHIDLKQDKPQDTIGFAQYFNDVLEDIPKNSADDNYDKLMYIFEVIFMELTGTIKQFQVPISDQNISELDDSKSIIGAIHQFSDYQASAAKQGISYRFVSLKVEPDPKQVSIRYVDENQFEKITKNETPEKKEG